MKRTFKQIGTDIGTLVEEKNRAYGSSFTTVGDALQLLYPNGIALQQMADALLLTRIWDKMMRIATDRDALGESPYGDIAGYGILGVAMHEKGEDETAWQGSANDQDATATPKAQPDFAAQTTSSRITTNDAVSNALTSLLCSGVLHASSSAQASTSTSSAPVPIAAEAASANAADRKNPDSAAWFCATGCALGWCVETRGGIPIIAFVVSLLCFFSCFQPYKHGESDFFDREGE